MPLSELITPELPYLRRFARAILGSQHAGDAQTAAMLTALVADPSRFDTNLPPKVAAFRVFVDVLKADSPEADGQSRMPPALAQAERRLSAMSYDARLAFLLLAMEGLKPGQIAEVLRCAPGEAEALIEQAGREMAQQVATSVLVIEDEPLIALDLADVVTSLGHTVCATAATHTEAVAAFQAHRPGLVLADVQLADGSSGLDAVREILRSFEVPVIFITAFPERLLTGKPPEPAFLINKPFQTDTVKAIVSQALFFGYKARKPGG